MRAYDLKPTYENLLETYRKDTIGRNKDIFHFVTILDSIEDSCSIALDGKWGSGKTFFVKQVKMVLDAHNSYIDSEQEEDRDEIVSIRESHYGKEVPLQQQVCVYYDAWANDNDDDPIMSLVYTILQQVNCDFSFKNVDCLDAGASIIELFTGRNWTGLAETLKGSSPLDALTAHKDVEALVGEFLESLLQEKGERLVVFIDELDRCKPDFAVRLLERIKHYFTNDRITFVFSVNSSELQHTIKKHYGTGFDSSRYLDRFFDLRVSLPQPDMKKYFRDLAFNEGHYIYDIVCGEVIKTYHFELREIAKYLRLAKIAAYHPTHGGHHFAFSSGNAIHFCLYFVVPIVIGLRVQNLQRYLDFIEGRDCTPMLEIAERLKHLGFRELLSENETFDEGISNRKRVTVEQKMKEVYDAIFVTTYGVTTYQTRIADMEFNAGTKDVLLRAAGLLSDFNKLDID